MSTNKSDPPTQAEIDEIERIKAEIRAKNAEPRPDRRRKLCAWHQRAKQRDAAERKGG